MRRLTVRISAVLTVLALCLGSAYQAGAAPFVFSTGPFTNQMGSASRPAVGGAFEIESADDFILTAPTQINRVQFTGLLVGGNISNVNLTGTVLEIYRVFPNDSNVGRTSGPPTFSTPQVPTRANSPSDVELVGRSRLDFSGEIVSQIAPSFTVLNSVTPG